MQPKVQVKKPSPPIPPPQNGRPGPEQDREDAPETLVDLYTKLPVKEEDDLLD